MAGKDDSPLLAAKAEFSDADHRFMARALELAEKGLNSASPNPRVGCVLVKQGLIVGEGWHQRAGMPHAEVEAIANFHSNHSHSDGRSASNELEACTVYVTLEPCAHYGRTPPCCDRLVEVGVNRVVIGAVDPNPLVAGAGINRIRAAGIEVNSGLMADASERLNCGFFSRMQRKRPWVRVKLAASLDGRTALATGESKWITSSEARADVQRLRARADCILTGIGTVLADDPRMTVRLQGNNGDSDHQQPTLAIVDSNCRTPNDAQLFNSEREVLIFTNTGAPGQVSGTIVQQQTPTSDGRVCLHRVLLELGRRAINEVHVEGGAEIAASLLAEKLVDELVVYQAPLILGADARSLVAVKGLTSMEQRLEFEYVEVSQVGADLRLTLKPHY